MNKITILGHKNPDTDSIVSAIAMQEYFKVALGKESQAYRTGDLNNEAKFILEEFGVPTPELMGDLNAAESVALVDHNQIVQTLEGLDYAKVDYIVDHHSSAFITERPIFTRIEPIGSTASLVAKMFFEKGVNPTEAMAKLLLVGMLSDTLNFTSPTTTAEDKELAVKLNAIAKLEQESFVTEMFKAKSSLEGISVTDIITLDYKTFEMGTNKVGVGTWETTSPESVNSKKAEIFEALEKKKAAEQLDYLFFMVVDILQSSCQLYVLGEVEQILAEKTFGQGSEDKVMVLLGVVSRKKQIVPQLTEELNK